MISEATVIAVAVALYLFDCLVLLERGQALWSRGRMSFGSTHYQIRGRAVALLNPFTPFFPAFRTLPLFSNAPGVRLSRAARVLTPVATMGLLQFVLVFLALPYCLYRAPGWPFFIFLLLAYATAIAMLSLLWWRFRRAGFATRPLFGLGFAWLACLPLSVNASRRAGLAFDVALDARRAMRLLSAGERQRARHGLAAQLAEALQEIDEADASARRLLALKQQLDAERGDERN